MYLINFYVHGREQPFSMRYRNKNEAEKVYAMCKDAMKNRLVICSSSSESYFLSGKDDSDHVFTLIVDHIEHVILADVEADLNGLVEMQLLQARVQAAGQRKAQADPTLNLGLAKPTIFHQ